jgi:hypothetical protein
MERKSANLSGHFTTPIIARPLARITLPTIAVPRSPLKATRLIQVACFGLTLSVLTSPAAPGENPTRYFNFFRSVFEQLIG